MSLSINEVLNQKCNDNIDKCLCNKYFVKELDVETKKAPTQMSGGLAFSDVKQKRIC